MPNRDILFEALKDFMGDEEAAQTILNQADEVGRANRERDIIIRENEADEADTEETPVDEVGEEVVEEVVEEEEAVEEVAETNVDYELELTDEILGEIAEVVAQSIGFKELKEEVISLRSQLKELQTNDDDERPVRQRRTIRPTLRSRGDDLGQSATEVEKEDLNRDDKMTMAERRSVILKSLRAESSGTAKKQD